MLESSYQYPYFLYGLTANTLAAWSFFLSLSDISAPTAAVAEVKAFNRTNARIGLKSRPKIGGRIPRKRFRYGSVIWNTGCKTATPEEGFRKNRELVIASYLISSFLLQAKKSLRTLGLWEPRQQNTGGDDKVVNAQKVGKATDEDLFSNSISWNSHSSTLSGRVDVASDHAGHLLSLVFVFEGLLSVKVGHMARGSSSSEGLYFAGTSEEHRCGCRVCHSKDGEKDCGQALGEHSFDL